MNKQALIKLVAFILVPFLVFLIAAYFTYPYLNEDKYERIVEENQSDFGLPLSETPADTLGDESSDSLYIPIDSLDTSALTDTLVLKQLKEIEKQNLALKQQLDSLSTRSDSLQRELTKKTNILQAKEAAEAAAEAAKLSDEEFAQLVKSLLNLEEDDLGPILSQLTNQQLVRLYKNGGNIQREKILRALKSEKAARLMTEIM